MTTTHNRIVALIAVYTERYVLPVVYLCFATTNFSKCADILSGRLVSENPVFIDATYQLTLLLLCIFTSLLLLLGRRAAVPPKQLKLILVPLTTAFFNFFYYTVPFFPAAWQINLCPQNFQKPIFFAGLACIIIGPAFAFWSMLHLGRSFGIYVTVRKVVTTGPYQWVRHPMYLGWVCLFIGFALANFSGAYFLLVAINISLMIYRAKLEQIQMAANSAEYREYMKHTRFIFPWFRKPGQLIS